MNSRSVDNFSSFSERVEASGILMSPTTQDDSTKPLLSTNHTQVNSDTPQDPRSEGGTLPVPINVVVPPVNLEETFWYMKQRQWARIQRASHGKPRTFVYTFLICYFILYGVYLTLQIKYFHVGLSNTYALEYILMGFVSAGAGLLSPRFGSLIKTVIFEVYGYLYTFFLMNMYTLPRKYIPLSFGFFGLIVLTIINYLFYPMIIRAWYTCTGDVSSHVDVSDSELGNGKRYEIIQTSPCSPPYHCLYEGGLFEGKPHNLGTWIDTSYQGEFLTGYWKDGYPIGPFESMENDTRNLLVNLRIIYASNAGGQYFLSRTPLMIGVACVEACVSGNFFEGYPMVNMIVGPTQTKITDTDCIKKILERRDWIHIDDDKTTTSVTVSIDPRYKRLNVTGFHSENPRESKVTISLNKKKKTNGKKTKTSLFLSVGDTWKPAGGREGILFIHGIYHTLEDSLKRFGQFLALGHFPAYIKPFLFNWPSSTNPLFYYCAASVASDNDTHRDLHRFLKMLKKAGILTLHIMCHSMGSRFFLRSFPVIRNIFKKRIPRVVANESTTDYDTFGTFSQYSKGINLQNLILMNPDYETETFVNDYSELQDYISNITVYADSRDGALVLANILNRKSSLGLSLVGRSSKSSQKTQDNNHPASNLGDLDIIDTSDLDRNMESQFHGYFNINRMMVDDLYELIVTGKSAEQRTSRLKPYGKVYRFTLVPSSVVTV